MTLTALPDLNTLDSDELKALLIQQRNLVLENHALVLEKTAELESHQDEIKRLKLFIAKLQRMQFGPSSEKLGCHIDQLELGLEDLEANATVKPAPPAAPSVPISQPARGPLPA